MFSGLGLSFLSLAIMATYCLAHPLNPDNKNQLVGAQKTETGRSHHRSDIFTQEHPKGLDFLGSYKGKNWFIIRTNVTLYTARWTCANEKLKLARFESADEIQIIVNSTTSGDDLAWTDAEVIPSISSYSWGDVDFKPINGSFFMRNDDRLGLAIGRYSDMSRLVTQNEGLFLQSMQTEVNTANKIIYFRSRCTGTMAIKTYSNWM